MLFQPRIKSYFPAVDAQPCYINELPLEVLMEVLALTVPLLESSLALEATRENCCLLSPSEDGEKKPTCTRQCREWNWLEVLRVCKRWQDAALACPAFWRRLPLQNQISLSKTINHSGNTSLHLISHSSNTSPKLTFGQFRLLLDIVPRLQTLHIENHSPATGYIAMLFRACIAAGAPRLQYLHLAGSSFSNQIVIHDAFNPGAPYSLRTLHLHRFDFSNGLAHLLAPTLSSLTLRACSSPWLNVDDMIDTLSRMSSLQELILSDTPLPAELNKPEKSVPLPSRCPLSLWKLRTLEIEAGPWAVANFFRAVHIPPSALRALVYTHDVIEDEASFQTALNRNAEHFRGWFGDKKAKGPSYTALKLDYDFECSPRCTAIFTYEAPWNDPFDKLPKRFTLTHKWPSAAHMASSIEVFTSALAAFIPVHAPDSTLQIYQTGSRLGEEPAFDHSNSAWYRCAKGMRDLYRLVLDETAVYEFLGWLSRAEASSGLFYSKLSTLVVKAHDLAPPDADHGPSSYQLLLDYVNRQMRLGSTTRIFWVTLDDVQADRYMIADLRKALSLGNFTLKDVWYMDTEEGVGDKVLGDGLSQPPLERFFVPANLKGRTIGA